MARAVINIQDPVGKTVGTRTMEDAGRYGMGLQKMANQILRSQAAGGLCPKGVYRFPSHEEADAWMLQAIVKRALRIQT